MGIRLSTEGKIHYLSNKTKRARVKTGLKTNKPMILLAINHDDAHYYYHSNQNFEAIYYGRSETQQNWTPFTSVHK